MHIFSDASEKVISAAAYCVGLTIAGLQSKSLVHGKAKVLPRSGHTIPLLELWAAFLAVEVYETICDQLHSFFEPLYFYTDSKVVLGYIQNQTRWFTHTLVIEFKLPRSTVTNPSQWFYVKTGANPADCATRPK